MPAGSGSPRCGIHPGFGEDLPHGGMGDRVSQGGEFPLDPAVTPRGILGRHPQDQFPQRVVVGGRPGPRWRGRSIVWRITGGANATDIPGFVSSRRSGLAALQHHAEQQAHRHHRADGVHRDEQPHPRPPANRTPDTGASRTTESSRAPASLPKGSKLLSGRNRIFERYRSDAWKSAVVLRRSTPQPIPRPTSTVRSSASTQRASSALALTSPTRNPNCSPPSSRNVTEPPSPGDR